MLTSAQYVTLRNYINADPVFSTIPNEEWADEPIMAALNSVASPALKVWETKVQPNDIINAIDWSKYTPNTATPTDTDLNVNIWRARLEASWLKRDNLWALLDVTNGTIDASKPLIRAGLRDAVISVPTGTNGATVHPGGASGVDVLTVCTRDALLIEKILTTGPTTTGTVTADIMGFIGEINGQELRTARTWV